MASDVINTNDIDDDEFEECDNKNDDGWGETEEFDTYLKWDNTNKHETKACKIWECDACSHANNLKEIIINNDMKCQCCGHQYQPKKHNSSPSTAALSNDQFIKNKEVKFNLFLLKVGDKVYHRNKFGKFHEGTIVDIDANHEHRIKIHYIGREDKYDEWCDRSQTQNKIRFAEYKSISGFTEKKTMNLSKGSKIKIKIPEYLSRLHFRDNIQYNQWINVKLHEIDDISGQVSYIMDIGGKKIKLWTYFGSNEIYAPRVQLESQFASKIKESKYNAYSYGLRFFYWDKYKNNSDTQDPADKWSGSTRNPSVANEGHTMEDLYVAPKYDNLKDESLNNEICSIKLYAWNFLTEKANEFMKYQHVRGIGFCPRRVSADCYDMHFGQLILTDHLIAIMAVNNYDALRANFGQTFRCISKTESIWELKERHRNYYYLGRRLRECVECFGMKCGTNANNISLYYGINTQCTFSSLNAFVKGPLYTTTDYGVAANFCENKGMILEFSMNVNDWRMNLNEGIDAYQRLCCFDIGWLNDYSNEQTIFFIGGINKLMINTIIEAPTGRNHSLYIKGLRQITYNMNCGGNTFELNGLANSKHEQQIVFRLLSHILWIYYPNHPHAHEFRDCTEYFKHILQSHCRAISNIYFHEENSCKIQNAMFKYDNGWIKLNILLKIFPNTQNIAYNLMAKNVFLEQTFIYENILSFLRENNEFIQLRSIQIQINPLRRRNMESFIQRYKDELSVYNWSIYIDVIKNVNEGLIGMDDVKEQITIMFINKAYGKCIPIQPNPYSLIENRKDFEKKLKQIDPSNECVLSEIQDIHFLQPTCSNNDIVSYRNGNDDSESKSSTYNNQRNSDQASNNENNENRDTAAHSIGIRGNDKDMDNDKNKKKGINKKTMTDKKKKNEQHAEKYEEKHNEKQIKTKLVSKLKPNAPTFLPHLPGIPENTPTINSRQQQKTDNEKKQHVPLTPVQVPPYLLHQPQYPNTMSSATIILNQPSFCYTIPMFNTNIPCFQSVKAPLMKGKKQRKKKQKPTSHSLSWQPLRAIRVLANIHISRTMTESIIPSMIKETFSNLFWYLDITTAMQFQDNKTVYCSNTDISKILNYGFHDASSNETLYCIIKQQNKSVQQNHGKQWIMLDALYTANELEQFKIDRNALPTPSRLSKKFIFQLESAGNIKNILLTDPTKTETFIEKTQWHTVNVFNRYNTKRRLSLSLSKEEFIKDLKQHIHSIGDNIALIPILMFDNVNHWIEHLLIVRVDTNKTIGISLIYCHDRIKATGIHLDKTEIYKQHISVLPQHHQCNCLSAFDTQSDIDDIQIGNPYEKENKINALYNNITELQQEKAKLQDLVARLTNPPQPSSIISNHNLLFTTSNLNGYHHQSLVQNIANPSAVIMNNNFGSNEDNC